MRQASQSELGLHWRMRKGLLARRKHIDLGQAEGARAGKRQKDTNQARANAQDQGFSD